MPSPSEPSPRPRRRADTGPIPLAPEDVAPAAGGGGRKATTKACPSCGRTIPGAGWICSACGFDVKEGRKPAHRPKPCRECGYDLTGVVNDTCPECDALIERGKVSLLADERAIGRASYRKALIGIGVGLAAVALVAGLGAGGIKAVPMALLGVVVCWPVAIVVYALTKIFWDGLDEPLGLLSLRALAALSVGAAAAMLLMPLNYGAAFRPIGMAKLLLMDFCVIGALNSACEEELDDALAYSIPFVLLGAFGPMLVMLLL